MIVATPADVAAQLVEGFDPRLAAGLREIPYAPMRAVGVAFRNEDVPVALDGFGFLAARKQGVRILGAFYTSSIIPEHAPPGTTYLRDLSGRRDRSGDRHARRRRRARRSCSPIWQTILGITAEPVAYHEVVWPKAIPQYRLPHRALVAAIERLEAAHSGFALVGNAYRGLGVGDNVRDALAVAARIGAEAASPAEAAAAGLLAFRAWRSRPDHGRSAPEPTSASLSSHSRRRASAS